jgi:hypothetical protein
MRSSPLEVIALAVLAATIIAIGFAVSVASHHAMVALR